MTRQTASSLERATVWQEELLYHCHISFLTAFQVIKKQEIRLLSYSPVLPSHLQPLLFPFLSSHPQHSAKILMEELNFLVLPSVLQPLCARLGFAQP